MDKIMQFRITLEGQINLKISSNNNRIRGNFSSKINKLIGIWKVVLQLRDLDQVMASDLKVPTTLMGNNCC